MERAQGVTYEIREPVNGEKEVERAKKAYAERKNIDDLYTTIKATGLMEVYGADSETKGKEPIVERFAGKGELPEISLESVVGEWVGRQGK